MCPVVVLVWEAKGEAYQIQRKDGIGYTQQQVLLFLALVLFEAQAFHTHIHPPEFKQ